MQVKNNMVIKLIVFVIALQILNMSIDIPASSKDTAAQDYNYIDTYVEYLAEVVLKYENAIPETNHRQHKQFPLHKHLQIICQPIQVSRPGTLCYQSLIKTYPCYSNRFAYQFIKEIYPPPPKSG